MDNDQEPSFVIATGHGINTYKKCPSCGGTNFEVRNHSLIWHDGDVYCKDCGAYVRSYDAG